jgi:hypothetical protein
MSVKPLARKSREPEGSNDFRVIKPLRKRLGREKNKAGRGLLPKADERRRLESASFIGDQISLVLGQPERIQRQSPQRGLLAARRTWLEQRPWPNSDGVFLPSPDQNNLCRGKSGQL